MAEVFNGPLAGSPKFHELINKASVPSAIVAVLVKFTIPSGKQAALIVKFGTGLGRIVIGRINNGLKQPVLVRTCKVGLYAIVEG